MNFKLTVVKDDDVACSSVMKAGGDTVVISFVLSFDEGVVVGEAKYSK
jgi:hypothetical protein